MGESPTMCPPAVPHLERLSCHGHVVAPCFCSSLSKPYPLPSEGHCSSVAHLSHDQDRRRQRLLHHDHPCLSGCRHDLSYRIPHHDRHWSRSDYRLKCVTRSEWPPEEPGSPSLHTYRGSCLSVPIAERTQKQVRRGCIVVESCRVSRTGLELTFRSSMTRHPSNCSSAHPNNRRSSEHHLIEDTTSRMTCLCP